MFEKATRLKLRFETVKGLITVEDLWDLPLSSRDEFNLDSVAKKLFKKVKDSEEEPSFVTPVTVNREREMLTLQFELVKHVISVKLKEREDREAVALKKERKEHILRLIKEKKDAEFSSKSIEELTKELENL